MSSETEPAGIADASRPNAGRIYDYFLGGNHNFEIDRQVADQMTKFVPFLPQISRLIRWFLGETTRRLAGEGFDKFLDFASGLPTVDHIHEVTPKGTKVLYSDIDPVTVAYAQEILKGLPDVRYVQCDAGKPEDLLESGLVEKLFGKDRKVAVGLNGIAYFIPDDAVEHSLKTLYDWAEKGSKLIISDADLNKNTKELQAIMELYKQAGQGCYPRTQEKLFDMAKPWKADDPGPMILEEWIGLERNIEDQSKEVFGIGFYGVILKKD